MIDTTSDQAFLKQHIQTPCETLAHLRLMFNEPKPTEYLALGMPVEALLMAKLFGDREAFKAGLMALKES